MTTEELRVAIETALRRRDPVVRVNIVTVNGKFLAFVDGHADALVWGSSMADTADEALRRLARGFGLRDDGSDPAEEVERLRAALDDADNLASCQRDTIGTLTRALHDAADRLGCADYDDVCAAVADALDDAEKREREHVDEANALRMERDRLRVENVRLLNTIESLSAQLCDTDRGRGEAREEARRLRADNARLDDVARGALDDLARAREELDATRASLDRAHHAVRQYGPRCSHPECDALAPLRCDDCGARFCDVHDEGGEGHNEIASDRHAVGPDDLMAGAAMRAAGGDR